jgi:hypothetical protein
VLAGHVVLVLAQIQRPFDVYTLMAVVAGDPYKPEIWDAYRRIGLRHETAGLHEEAPRNRRSMKRGGAATCASPPANTRCMPM